MNILFILGNGFDVNLGLHTGYQDFYDYYLKLSSYDAVVTKLKKYLEKTRYTTWADLELGLGAYTKEVENLDEMRMVYFDLDDNLREYLKREEEKFSATEDITNAVTSGLIAPHLVLPQGMQDAINAFRRSKDPYLIDVISFNYTSTLEKILKPLDKINYQIQLGNRSIFRSVKHIHMSLEDEDVIMGVNDESQILNKELLNDGIRGLLIKPYINQQLQNLVDSQCVKLIQEADIICLFGVSIGETDLMWWQTIGTRFQNAPVRILFFAYDKSIVTRNSERINKYNQCRSLLFERMGILNPTEEQLSRVFVGYKTDLFKVG